MDIVDKRKKTAKVIFNDIERGSVFIHGDGTKMFKIEPANGMNAAVIGTGMTWRLLPKDTVTPLPTAKLVIE